jgi:hypothetical protein
VSAPKPVETTASDASFVAFGVEPPSGENPDSAKLVQCLAKIGVN